MANDESEHESSDEEQDDAYLQVANNQLKLVFHALNA